MTRYGFLSILLSCLATSAGAASPGPDFNNDGFDDLVIGAPGESLSGKSAAGVFHIIYGGADGLSSAGDQLWHQNQSGVGGKAENGDRFGSAFAWGDFDGDGFDDLAVSVDREAVNSRSDAGAVQILYGSADGLTATGDQMWSQDVSGISDSTQPLDRFGFALSAGNFNGDEFIDLAIGVPGEDFDGKSAAGVVHIVYGSASGLNAAGDEYFHQNSSGIADSPQSGDQFGATLATGDFDGDSFDDLAIGVPFEDNEGVMNAGLVHVLYGSEGGLNSAGSDTFEQDDSSALEEDPESNDQFGAALATGDFNDDGFDELAVGVPLENVGVINNAGIVHIFYGHDGGLEDDPEEVWSQDTSGISDAPEFGDWFGASLASGDFDGDGVDDLAIGVPFEDVTGWVNAGALHVLFGSSNGLTATGDQFITQNSAGVPNAPRPGDTFSASLAVGDFNDDGSADLAIGIPGEQINFKNDAGAVNVGFGSNDGLLNTLHQFWHQDAGGIGDTASDGDGFGASLGPRLHDAEGLLPPL